MLNCGKYDDKCDGKNQNPNEIESKENEDLKRKIVGKNDDTEPPVLIMVLDDKLKGNDGDEQKRGFQRFYVHSCERTANVFPTACPRPTHEKPNPYTRTIHGKPNPCRAK